MDKRKLTLAITSWERYAETLNSFIQVVDYPGLQEIVIVDDFSTIEVYKKLDLAVSFCPKVRLFRNRINYGCYLNKRMAVSLSSNPFVILWDSDNTMTKEYLDKIFEQEWDEDTILAPDFAMPHFSYQEFGGVILDKHNIAQYIDKPMASTALNTCNMFVNRNRYLETFDSSIDPVTCDSIYFNYCWLKDGGKIHILKGLQYPHLVHEKSHYKTFIHTTPKHLLSEIEENLRQLR